MPERSLRCIRCFPHLPLKACLDAPEPLTFRGLLECSFRNLQQQGHPALFLTGLGADLAGPLGTTVTVLRRPPAVAIASEEL